MDKTQSTKKQAAQLDAAAIPAMFVLQDGFPEAVVVCL